jgi:hypothetical protein
MSRKKLGSDIAKNATEHEVSSITDVRPPIKETRVKDPKLLARIRESRCIVCGLKQVDACHIKTRGSGGHDVPDNLMSLCRRHHIEQGRWGFIKFIDRYPIVGVVLADKGWTIQDVLGVKKLVRED